MSSISVAVSFSGVAFAMIFNSARPLKPGMGMTLAASHRHFLEQKCDVQVIDPFTMADFSWPSGAAVFVVATNHEVFRSASYPEHSIVIDPWGSVLDQPRIQLIRPGRHSAHSIDRRTRIEAPESLSPS